LSANLAPIEIRKMSASPDFSATENPRQDNQSTKELLTRREQIADMVVAERERHAAASSFIVRGEIARHIRTMTSRRSNSLCLCVSSVPCDEISLTNIHH